MSFRRRTLEAPALASSGWVGAAKFGKYASLATAGSGGCGEVRLRRSDRYQRRRDSLGTSAAAGTVRRDS